LLCWPRTGHANQVAAAVTPSPGRRRLLPPAYPLHVAAAGASRLVIIIVHATRSRLRPAGSRPARRSPAGRTPPCPPCPPCYTAARPHRAVPGPTAVAPSYSTRKPAPRRRAPAGRSCGSSACRPARARTTGVCGRSPSPRAAAGCRRPASRCGLDAPRRWPRVCRSVGCFAATRHAEQVAGAVTPGRGRRRLLPPGYRARTM
jgi:hypothetical protein